MLLWFQGGVLFLTNTEKLIEAIVYAQDSGIDWWDIFEDIEDAKSILRSVSKEIPDEYQIAHLLSLTEEEDIFIENPIATFKKCISKLRKDLKTA